MRQEGAVEGSLPVKYQDSKRNQKKQNKKIQGANNENVGNSNKIKTGSKKTNVPPCQHCGKKGHPPFKCWRRPDAKCIKCNQQGHEAVICKSKIQQHEVEAQVVEQEEDDQLFVATCFTSRDSNESWLIDSGCTNHMTYDKALFKELRSTETKKVRIGNGEYIHAKGKGTIAIASCSGTKFITHVLYVPDIDQNLLSVGQLMEKGYVLHFVNKACVIEDPSGHEIFKVKMVGKSFSLNPLEEEQTAFQVKESVTEVWHKRLGHYHHEGLLRIKSKRMANDLPEFDDPIPYCKACQFGKQNRKSFPKSTWRATHKLQLIHTDVSGPQRTPSLAGSRYYIAFIDDFTRMCWIYSLKFKSEVARVFWKFQKMVENQSGCKIQVLKSDNGKEYTSEEFNLFCEESGIEHQLTAPYTPQQNGVSERRNRYILEMTRCMLHEKNLPKQVRGRSSSYGCYFTKQASHKSIEESTTFRSMV